MGFPRRTAVLLGAGASAEAGIPTASAMTDRLAERLDRRPRGSEIASAYRFVCDVLRAGTELSQPEPNLDVERVFAAVELLSARDRLEIAPFVGSWHSALGSEELTPATFEALSLAIRYELRALVLSEPDACVYLAPLVEAGRQEGGITIATLNYDLTIEQCAERHGVSYDTSMEHWVVYGLWSWLPEGIRLLKLHGSITEVWAEVEHWDEFLPYQGVHWSPDPRNAEQPPLLVFGAGTKLRAEGPFLGLLLEFETQLREAERLLVVGYSFRDEHINQAVVRWSHFSTGRKLTVVDPDWPEDPAALPDADFRSTLCRHLLPPAENPGKFEPRLEIIREPCSKALEKYAIEPGWAAEP